MCPLSILCKTYQNSISCSQEDIDLISKIFKIVLDGSSGLVGAIFVLNVSHVWIDTHLRFTTLIFSKVFPGFFDCF